jgi:hypothetical protein
MATIAEPLCVSSISFRRSDASATTPLMIEKITIGTKRNKPTRPSARPFRSGGTRSETCHSSAAFCIHVPVNESSRPIQIRRKFLWRSAVSAGGSGTNRSILPTITGVPFP